MANYLSREEAAALGLDDSASQPVSRPTFSTLTSEPTAASDADPSGKKDFLRTPRGREEDIPEWGRKYPNLYGVAGASRETLGPIVEALGMAGGAAVAGTGGIPTGPGAILTGAAGGAGGYMAAKNLLDAVDQALGNKAPATVMDEVKELPSEFAAGAAMEMGGRAAGQGIKNLLDAGGKIVKLPTTMLKRTYNQALETPTAAEGRAIQKETGFDFTPAQLTGNRFLNMAENTARKSFQTADQVADFDIKQANKAIERINVLLDKVGKPGKGAETLGHELQFSVENAISLVQKARRAQAEIDYGTVKAMVGDKPVMQFNTLKDEIKSIISEYDVPGGENIVKQAKFLLSQMSKKTNIGKALNMRQVYSQAARGTGDIFKDIDKGQSRMLASRMLRAIDSDFELTPAFVEGANVGEALKNANQNYKISSQHIAAIENSVLGKMLGKNTFDPLSGQTINSIAPEKIAARIINMHPSELRATKQVIAGISPETWHSVKRYSIEQALQEGMKIPPSAGMKAAPFSPAKYISSLPSEEQLSVMFGPKELAEIKTITNGLIRIGDRTGSNTSNTALTMEFLSSLTPTGLAKMGAKAVGLKTIANAMTTQEGRAALRKVTEAGGEPQRLNAAIKAVMLGYSTPEADAAEAGTMADYRRGGTSDRRRALDEAAQDSPIVGATPSRMAAPSSYPADASPRMNAAERERYNAETQRMQADFEARKRAEQGGGGVSAPRQKIPVKQVVVKTRDGEELKYQLTRPPYTIYDDDPNE